MVGLQAWIQSVNANGGVNGHLIRLITRDDQADPSQNASHTQALVEQSKAVAFVSNWAITTQQASADYLRRKSIPVIGGDLGSQQTWGVNPMFFPQGAIRDDGISSIVAGLARVAVPQAKRDLGIFVCAEAAVCANGARVASETASKFGFRKAYSGSASFAAPGYTAECLNMKTAGVQVVFAIFPASAMRNVARDCARQGLEVIYSLTNGIMEGDFNQNPNFEGSAVIHVTFPFAGSDTPQTAEYAKAMKKYQPDQISNPASASGWAAGKIFGAAVERVSGPVTTAKVLAALHTFDNETLDGLTIPLSYRRKPIVPKPCYFLSVIKSGAYVPVNGGKFLCQ